MWPFKNKSVETSSFVQDNVKSKSIAISSQEVQDVDGSIFYVRGSGPSYILGDSNNAARIAAFCTIPEVNVILNLRARAAGNMRVIPVDTKTDKEVNINHWLIDLINNPNYFQTREELFGQTTLFNDIFGDEYLHMTRIIGVEKPIGLFTLPPQAVELKDEPIGTTGNGPFYLQNKLPERFVYYFNDAGGEQYKLNKDNLLHLNTNNITFRDKKDIYKGFSKLDALKVNIENIREAYEARNVLIVNRGALGILSNAAKDGIGGVAPMNPKEKQLVQDEFSKYGLTKNKWQVIITNLALHWQQMAIDVDKLKLFEETQEDTLKICDAYGTPYEILSNVRNTTFDNKKEAMRQWYRETIIPEANTRLAAINRKFNVDSMGFKLIPSFAHLPIFETERKERAQTLMLTVNALSKALQDTVITKEQYAEELKRFGI